MLWSQAFLLEDNTIFSLFTYGLALNSSIDALIFFPFMVYRITCKSLKEVYKDEGIYAVDGLQSLFLHTNNILDLGLLQKVMTAV